MDWSKYLNFSESEFKCSHTGACIMKPEFMEVLQSIRTELGFPMPVTSGFRHPSHPIEVAKAQPGEHSFGCAVDIGIRGFPALELMRVAMNHGIQRIGVQQKGEGRFIHLGMGDKLYPNRFSQAIWSY